MSKPSLKSLPVIAAPTWVICLCADWCGLCRDYAQVLAQMAARFPQFRFVWLDIEDDAQIAGDFDIETFPTLLVADEAGTRFFGPLTPQPETLSRLLNSLERSGLAAVPHDATVAALLEALASAPRHWVDAPRIHALNRPESQ